MGQDGQSITKTKGCFERQQYLQCEQDDMGSYWEVRRCQREQWGRDEQKEVCGSSEEEQERMRREEKRRGGKGEEKRKRRMPKESGEEENKTRVRGRDRWADAHSRERVNGLIATRK
jgi:hypothetical protein